MGHVRYYSAPMTNHVELDDTAAYRRSILRLLGRVTAYYLIVSAALWLTLTFFPVMGDFLPVGGVGQIGNYDDPAIQELEQALLTADEEELEEIATGSRPSTAYHGKDWVRGAFALLGAMICTLFLMLPVSWVYRIIHNDEEHDHSLDETTLVLPAVVAGIVLIVQHSLALAFSLAGIVAGVRFRRALTDTFDTLFILLAIGVGIAAGTRSLEIAVVLSVFFSYTALLVSAYGDGLESRYLSAQKRQRRARKLAKIESELEQP